MTRELAIKRASLDGEARIVAEATSISLVTPLGEVWRVFDSEGPDGDTRAMPRNDSRVWARVFIGLDASQPVRIYRFGVGESRSTIAGRMLIQLDRAKRGDDLAA